MPTIRSAVAADAPAIAAIYAHHVLHGTATFDTVPPSDGAWIDRIAAIAARGWPFLVAEVDGAVAGYAYAAQFRDRPAYAEAAEDSIYVAPERIGSGVGSALLPALLAASYDAGFRQMIAVIGDNEPASIALHARCGFVRVGVLSDVGRKFGRLLDVTFMQVALSAI